MSRFNWDQECRAEVGAEAEVTEARAKFEVIEARAEDAVTEARAEEAVTETRAEQQIATTQLNSTQSWVGLIFLRNHTTPQPKPNCPLLFLSSYPTKLDQIQYETLILKKAKLKKK